MGKKFALVYLIVLTLVMGGALAYGFIVGDFWEDGGELMDNPWGDCFPLRRLRRLFLLHRLDRLPGKLFRDHACLVGCHPDRRQCRLRNLCHHSSVPEQGRSQDLLLGRRESLLGENGRGIE